MPIYNSTGEPVDLSFLKERTPEAEAFWAAVDAMPVPRDEDEEPNDSAVLASVFRNGVKNDMMSRVLPVRPPVAARFAGGGGSISTTSSFALSHCIALRRNSSWRVGNRTRSV